MARIIYRKQLEDFAQSLLGEGVVYAPIEKHNPSGGSKFVFEALRPNSKIVFEYPVTIMPPKQFLLPPEDTLFTFESGTIKRQKPQKQVIFGVNFNDLEGLLKLKSIFKKPVTDTPFTEKAEQTLLVAIDRYSPPKTVGFDVYLQQLDTNRFAAFAGSPKGQKILKEKYFKTETVRIPKVVRPVDPLINNPMLAVALERSRGSAIWADLSERCFGCGVCSYVCPLCYCFETSDETSLPATEPINGKRVRKYSSCFSVDFAETSGHNFRANRADRIYNWYFHKFVRMPKEYDHSGCVDCGRCVALCPAKINYRLILKQVLEQFGGQK